MISNMVCVVCIIALFVSAILMFILPRLLIRKHEQVQ